MAFEARSSGAYRQVLDVLVLGVDDVGQVLAVDVLLEDPHGDLVLELVALEHVAPDNLGDGRAPVPRANDANLLFLPWSRGRADAQLGLLWRQATVQCMPAGHHAGAGSQDE